MIDEVVQLIGETVSATSHQKYNEWLRDNDAPSKLQMVLLYAGMKQWLHK